MALVYYGVAVDGGSVTESKHAQNQNWSSQLYSATFAFHTKVVLFLDSRAAQGPSLAIAGPWCQPSAEGILAHFLENRRVGGPLLITARF